MSDAASTATASKSGGDTVAYIIVIGLLLLGVRACGAEDSRPATTPYRSATSCSPNYSPCLPIVPDLNCVSVQGSVRVVGWDMYGLDADNDGIGCE